MHKTPLKCVLILLALTFGVYAGGAVQASESILTNYVDGDGFVAGVGIDPAPYSEPYFPIYNYYDHSLMDPVAVSSSEVDAFVEHLRTYDVEISIPATLSKLKYGAEAKTMQIVANHPIIVENTPGGYPQGALFTIIFPPGFDVKGNHTYPIVVLGLGHRVDSMNEEIFLDSVGVRLPTGIDVVHDCYQQTGEGVVFVYWNSGGTLCMGANENARVAFNEMIQLLHSDYDCNRNKVIARGSSRGGFTSLTIAENVVHNYDVHGTPRFDYNAVAVFSNASPLSLGTIAQMPVCNTSSFTSMWHAYYDGIGGSPAEFPYFYRFRDAGSNHLPPGYNPEFLYPVFQEQATDYYDYVNQNSPDDPANLEKLRGKFICLEYGTHDNYWPLNFFIKMDNELSKKGIEHTTIYRVGSGHGLGSRGSSYSMDMNDIFNEYMYHLLENGAGFRTEEPHKMGLFDSARNYVVDQDPITHLDHKRWFLRELPFSATFPWVLGSNVFMVSSDVNENLHGSPTVANEPGVIFLSGAKGTEWDISVQVEDEGGDPAGSYVIKDDGVFDESETAIVDWGIDWDSSHPRGWEYDVHPDRYPFVAEGESAPDGSLNDTLVWNVTLNPDGPAPVIVAPHEEAEDRYTNLGNDPDEGPWRLETEIANRQGTTAETVPYNFVDDRLAFSFGVDYIVDNDTTIANEIPIAPTLGCIPKSITIDELVDNEVELMLYPFIGNNDTDEKIIEYQILFKTVPPEVQSYEYRVGLKGTDGNRYNPNNEEGDKEYFFTANLDLPGHSAWDGCEAYGYLRVDPDDAEEDRARAAHPFTLTYYPASMGGTNTFILRVYELEVDPGTGEETILSTTDAMCTFDFLPAAQ